MTKRSISFFCCVVLVAFSRALSAGDTGDFGPARSATSGEGPKCEAEEQGAPEVSLSIAFSGELGRTITDENGTCYDVFGFLFFEDKVYPPEYWGVFPLYFFDNEVGVAMTVHNEGNRKAKLRLRSECYCLRTDGTSGADLCVPKEEYAAVEKNESAVVETSLTAGYAADVEEGLDRLLVKVMLSSETDENNGSHTITGSIGINPNNSGDNEFRLVLPGGGVVSRDNLHEDYAGYSGPAARVHVKPKGGGNQTGLIVDGATYDVKNSDAYDISGDMTVAVYNDNVNSDGKAMGHWRIGIDATAATVTAASDSDPILLVKEAIFCPPEYDGEVMKMAEALLGAD